MTNMEKIKAAALKNKESLKKNVYPGRGILQGLCGNGKQLVQIYWIMGRSENSRNRVFLEEAGAVRTAPYDESKMKDPSLIIYYPIRSYQTNHIVSNGDQTDTVYNGLSQGHSFEAALETRKFEPDAPNYTPRITGLINTEDPIYTYRFSIIRSTCNDPEFCERLHFHYEKGMPGVGYCIHTYDGDGKVLPSFSQYPYFLPIYDDAQTNLEEYWSLLNPENRISLLVKLIHKESNRTEILIRNRWEK